MANPKRDAIQAIKQARRENAPELDLSMMNLEDVPTQIGGCNGLEVLYLSQNRLVTLPSQLGNLTALEELDLAFNQLTGLPDQVSGLTALQSLDLSINRLREVPRAVGALRSLKTLNLAGNELTELPTWIGGLTKLRVLNLSNNRLAWLPSELLLLGDLRELYLDRNQLSALPPQLVGMTSLRVLSVRENQLTALPNDIGGLESLEVLDVGENQLTVVPSALGQLPNLETLRLENNPVMNLPEELLGQGTAAIVTYLHALTEATAATPPVDVSAPPTAETVETAPLPTAPSRHSIPPPGQDFAAAEPLAAEAPPQMRPAAKLVVVGEGGVGKTSLIRALQDGIFLDTEPMTHGIQIDELRMHHPDQPETEMALAVWDFGGQEIYHATHRFFLSNRALFLLVYHSRLGYRAGRLEYWLQTIHMHAPDAPVLIVATHLDQHRDTTLPIDQLRQRFPQIVGAFAISSATRQGVERLRSEVEEQAALLPVMMWRWPAPWLEAAAQLAALPDAYITLRDMETIMRQSGVRDEGIGVLAKWLHEIGDIIYFGDDPELADTVILKPSWVSSQISKVLDSQEIKRAGGIASREQLAAIWNDLSPMLHMRLIRMMERFDLLHATEDGAHYVVVESLPQRDAPYHHQWEALDHSRQLSLHYQFQSALPPGVPTWFLARTQRFSTGNHWRFGALLQDREGAHLALLRAFPREALVTLAVRGPYPHNFLALIKDSFETTLNRFPGIDEQLERLIPCPGTLPEGGPCPYRFPQARLQRRLREERHKIECPECESVHPVEMLLYGTEPQQSDTKLIRLESMMQQLSERVDQGLTHNLEMMQREFTAIYRRDQAAQEAHCPNAFLIAPVGKRKRWNNPMRQKWEMTLLCQEPGCWHPTEGHYIIERPEDWYRQLLPHIMRMARVLRFVTPVFIPFLGVPQMEYEEGFGEQLQVMQELVDNIEHMAHITEGISRVEVEHQAAGAELRALRRLLDELDPAQTWGGLTKVYTPEGHFLWLCEAHRKQYERG